MSAVHNEPKLAARLLVKKKLSQQVFYLSGSSRAAAIIMCLFTVLLVRETRKALNILNPENITSRDEVFLSIEEEYFCET